MIWKNFKPSQIGYEEKNVIYLCVNKWQGIFKREHMADMHRWIWEEETGFGAFK